MVNSEAGAWAHVHGVISPYIAGAIRDDVQAFRASYVRFLERLFCGLVGGPPKGRDIRAIP